MSEMQCSDCFCRLFKMKTRQRPRAINPTSKTFMTVWPLLLCAVIFSTSSIQAWTSPSRIRQSSALFQLVDRRSRIVQSNSLPANRTANGHRGWPPRQNTQATGRQSTNPRNYRNRPNKAASLKNSAVIDLNRKLQQIIKTQPGHYQQRSPAQMATDLLFQNIYFNNTVNINNTINGTLNSAMLTYDTISFNLVLQAWARQQSFVAAKTADDLLATLSQHPTLKADSYSYAAVLHAYAKSGGKVAAAQRAHELLQQLLLLQSTTSGTLLRTDICHNAVMDAWAVSGHQQCGERAEQLLRSLLKNGSKIQPSRVSFNACIKAWARAGQPKEAQRLLEEMKLRAANDGSDYLAPDKISYTTVICAWAKSDASAAAAKQAEGLLREMEHKYECTKQSNIRPDVVAYTSVLSCLSKCNQAGHAIATGLLERLEKYAPDKANAAFLNAWIYALSKSDQTRDSAATAEGILKYMQTAYATM
jgi:pentatricopeptide repeat protein